MKNSVIHEKLKIYMCTLQRERGNEYCFRDKLDDSWKTRWFM